MEAIPLMLSPISFTRLRVASRQKNRSAGLAGRHVVERGDGVVEGHGDADRQREPSGANALGERLEGLAIGLEEGPGVAGLRCARSDDGADPGPVVAAGPRPTD